MALKLIERNEIIAKMHALSRQGLRPAFTPSITRIKERTQANMFVPYVVSTTYRSPLVSQIYQSIYCQGESK